MKVFYVYESDDKCLELAQFGPYRSYKDAEKCRDIQRARGAAHLSIICRAETRTKKPEKFVRKIPY